jgi:hypothetical protein
LAEAALTNPMTGIADCCASAASGRVAAILPIRLINSRRLMADSGTNAGSEKHSTWKSFAYVRFGSIATGA